MSPQVAVGVIVLNGGSLANEATGTGGGGADGGRDRRGARSRPMTASGPGRSRAVALHEPPAREERGTTIDQPVILGGRYRVEHEFGRGGMAKVYRGEDTVLGRTVAIKVPAPQFADDPNFVTRFEVSVEHGARLSAAFGQPHDAFA